MGAKGHRKRMQQRLERQQQQPPPPTTQQQQQRAPRLGSGVGAAPPQPPPATQQQQQPQPHGSGFGRAPPPPVRSQPGGAGRQPADDEGASNRTWLECSESFSSQALNLTDGKTEDNEARCLAKIFASRFSRSPLASHLAGRVRADAGDADSALFHLLRALSLSQNAQELHFPLPACTQA